MTLAIGGMLNPNQPTNQSPICLFEVSMKKVLESQDLVQNLCFILPEHEIYSAKMNSMSFSCN